MEELFADDNIYCIGYILRGVLRSFDERKKDFPERGAYVELYRKLLRVNFQNDKKEAEIIKKKFQEILPTLADRVANVLVAQHEFLLPHAENRGVNLDIKKGYALCAFPSRLRGATNSVILSFREQDRDWAKKYPPLDKAAWNVLHDRLLKRELGEIGIHYVPRPHVKSAEEKIREARLDFFDCVRARGTLIKEMTQALMYDLSRGYTWLREKMLADEVGARDGGNVIPFNELLPEVQAFILRLERMVDEEDRDDDKFVIRYSRRWKEHVGGMSITLMEMA